MSKKPKCFGHFMDAKNNPNCDVCYLAGKCYEKWNENDKAKRAIAAEKEKPWNERKPLTEIFPEICDRCEGDSREREKTTKKEVKNIE